LNKLRLTNNVAIFFTSATGPEKFTGSSLNVLKLTGEPRDHLSATSQRVPMIVRWPGTVPAGRVSRQPWSAPDFAPTALQMAGAQPAPDATGISLLPALLGQPGTNAPALPDREVFKPPPAERAGQFFRLERE
jgi:uncharacterized sulfatase